MNTVLAPWWSSCERNGLYVDLWSGFCRIRIHGCLESIAIQVKPMYWEWFAVRKESFESTLRFLFGLWFSQYNNVTNHSAYIFLFPCLHSCYENSIIAFALSPLSKSNAVWTLVDERKCKWMSPGSENRVFPFRTKQYIQRRLLLWALEEVRKSLKVRECGHLRLNCVPLTLSVLEFSYAVFSSSSTRRQTVLFQSLLELDGSLACYTDCWEITKSRSQTVLATPVEKF